jgi:hypothetical protein
VSEPPIDRSVSLDRRKRAPNGVQRYVQVTVLLPPDLVAALDTEAEQAGDRSRSQVVRRACGEYLRRPRKRGSRERSSPAAEPC